MVEFVDFVVAGAVLIFVVGCVNLVVQVLLPFVPKPFARAAAELAHVLPVFMMALALGVVAATLVAGAVALAAPYVASGVRGVVGRGEQGRGKGGEKTRVRAAWGARAPPAADKPPSLSERTSVAAALAVPLLPPADIVT